MRAAGFVLALAASFAQAELNVIEGPTPIPRGDAQSDGDITITNGLFAVAFAVETAPPWGVARGGIVDIAMIKNGEIGYDIASLADFMPNNWSAWPTSYQRVSIEARTAGQVVIRTERDWGDVALVTTFRIRDMDERIELVTTMQNRGKSVLPDLLSGYVVWPDGGALFSVPGLTGLEESSEAEALADWSAAYDRDWTLGLHAPYAEVVAYSGRDRYLPHGLEPGETISFEATLQVVHGGNLAPLVEEEARRNGTPSGTVEGAVTDAGGEPLAAPAVIVEKSGKTYAWATGGAGRYALRLPAGQYRLYATAEGYSNSRPVEVEVAAGGSGTVDFTGLEPPGLAQVRVSDRHTGVPLDARLTLAAGPAPMIAYFGRSTFFTELGRKGEALLSLAPGPYRLRISAGGGFSSMPQDQDLDVLPGETAAVDVKVDVVARPEDRGWYAADLHHHSDVLDGFTRPEYVLRSELAAGVHIAFLSDHDSMINNAEMSRLSATRGMDFIPATELSPSWAHFNAYPVSTGKEVEIDVGAASVQEVFAEARRLGAEVVHVNHPYGDYGYFKSLDLRVEIDGKMVSAVPGGYDEGFDLVEITAGDNTRTMQHVWRLWNAGKRAYLAAGSDTHDVWIEESGSARTYVFVDGELTVDSFIAALKRGNAFASQGPLVYPSVLFGSELPHRPGELLELDFDVQAAAGLRSVQLIEAGTAIETIAFDGSTDVQPARFRVRPAGDTWYSVVVEDEVGLHAWSNPVWVRTND